jgi:DsbC/DsbD-like thiol-disulfide interchange protein
MRWRAATLSARLIRMRKAFFTLLASSILCAAPLAAAPGAEPLHVTAALIAEGLPPAHGKPLWVGLRMRQQAGWHTYWKNPGDAGMPTRIEWKLPDGWSASGIMWPAPSRLPVGPLASYGYEGDLVLPVKLLPPANWDGKTPVQISARANWLVCKNVCIPEDGSFTLKLPANPAPAERSLFALWRARVPQPMRFSVATAEKTKDRLLVTLAPAGTGQFFPEHEELVEPGDPPQIKVTGDHVTWSAKLGLQAKDVNPPASVAGVWVPDSGKPLYVETRLK